MPPPSSFHEDSRTPGCQLLKLRCLLPTKVPLECGAEPSRDLWQPWSCASKCKQDKEQAGARQGVFVVILLFCDPQLGLFQCFTLEYKSASSHRSVPKISCQNLLWSFVELRKLPNSYCLCALSPTPHTPPLPKAWRCSRGGANPDSKGLESSSYQSTTHSR